MGLLSKVFRQKGENTARHSVEYNTDALTSSVTNGHADHSNRASSKSIRSSVKEVESIDMNHDGQIDRDEVNIYIDQHTELWDMLSAYCNISKRECHDIARDVAYQMAKLTTMDDNAGFHDLKGHNVLREPTIEEFAAFHLKLKEEPHYDKLFFHRTVFCAFDYNNNDYIEEGEIDDFVDLFYNTHSIYASEEKLPPKEELTARILYHFDLNEDGRLDFFELRPLISGGAALLGEAIEDEDFEKHRERAKQRVIEQQKKKELKEKKEREEAERKKEERKRQLERERQTPSPTMEDMYMDDDEEEEDAKDAEGAKDGSTKHGHHHKSSRSSHRSSKSGHRSSKTGHRSSKTKKTMDDDVPKSPKSPKGKSKKKKTTDGDNDNQEGSPKSRGRKSISKKEGSDRSLRSASKKDGSSRSLRSASKKEDSDRSLRSASKKEGSDRSLRSASKKEGKAKRSSSKTRLKESGTSGKKKHDSKGKRDDNRVSNSNK